MSRPSLPPVTALLKQVRHVRFCTVLALGHGHFLAWIDAEFGMSEASALRFQQVAEKLSDKSVTVTDFAPTALYALAAPSTPDEVRDAVVERASNGESFTAADIKAQI